MKHFKVRIKFSDGNVLTEDVKDFNEEAVFERLRYREEWYKISDGAKYTYINPPAIVNIEITDVKENNRINEEVKSDL